MSSKGTKRKHEEDWDVVDFTGPTPVYSKSASKSGASRPSAKSKSVSQPQAQAIPATAPAPTTSKVKPLQADPYTSNYDSFFDSLNRPPAKSSVNHQPSGTSMYAPPATSNYAPQSASYSYASYPYGGGTHAGSSMVSPSSVPEALPPPAKKARKGKGKAADGAADEEKPEKRGAITKKKCPNNILDRVDRVMSQRFFMIDRRRKNGELREEFSVLGSTGNVYTVIIDKTPSCNCPDATKGNHCKHILFIYLKVLQVPQHSHVWYQKALLTSELASIFADAPPAPNSRAQKRVQEAYARATGKAPNTEASGSSSSSKAADLAKPPRRQPTADDDCPICYEGMHGAAESTLVWCETCGNAVHKGCFSEWAKSSPNNLTCVFCRAPWADPSSGGKGKGKRGAGAGAGASVSEGYLNLGAVAGLSRERDTSTYYQGPRRGSRYYGYQEYDVSF
ncbi:hypothetical protein HYDPIDRAFT_118776 [Hydnomerulius pinastri MD-312]|uniref:SWIM-type domain-containing protein n=1 Tax=Hydnomerulius pinastri MD-312 TaxID=994086 RepID=A0A0C9W8Y0_9AGAM|nr:hypothetical protein HYDPIDRAFT_118776 [Hydnomerulius pinastri MD-312]